MDQGSHESSSSLDFGTNHIKPIDDSLSDYLNENLEDSYRTRKLKRTSKQFQDEKSEWGDSLDKMN